MQPFLGPDFLLDTSTARRLYHDVVCTLPIVDYHNHLSPQSIADDQSWDNLGRIWLEGDHYKWRAMRWAGIDEDRITGSANFREKFDAFAKTMPQCLGNPLYHWTHLELQRYFGISDLLTPANADAIWEQANEQLVRPSHSARGLLSQMNVEFVGTTDDVCDSLEHHKRIADDPDYECVVVPSFRPDPAFKIELPGFANFIERLEGCAGSSIESYEALIDALLQRLDHFVAHGCKASDHGIDILRFATPVNHAKLSQILQKRLSDEMLSEEEVATFQTAVLIDLAKAYHERDLVMQMHIGAIRNNRSALFDRLGADVGGDSIGDREIAAPLNALLDAIEKTGGLPRTILYCLDPTKNEVIVTTAGNFQDGSIAGKIQAGSGWWYNDQLDGMEQQMTQLAQMGLLSRFIGMLTDSRSFLSFPRHEYFRRLVCQMIGGWVETGHVPNDHDLLDRLLTDICYQNAANWFLEGEAV
jgi:glucuronate isomerase